jgi:hypothetical protein
MTCVASNYIGKFDPVEIISNIVDVAAECRSSGFLGLAR